MIRKLISPEGNKLLKWGEQVRENPKTSMLSVPIFTMAGIVMILTGDKEGLAACFGHGGIAWKNYYKHNWRNPLLLRIALWDFETAARLSSGQGKPTVWLKCAETAQQLKLLDKAEDYYQRGIEAAKKISDVYQLAYVNAGYARLKMERGAFQEARELLNDARTVLKKGVDDLPDSLYLHVWYTQALIVTGEYYLATNDKKAAENYAREALAHSQEYKLSFRIHDAQMLLDKINQ